MTAVFFAAELDGEPAGGEHELCWIDDRAGEAFFHACHARAVSLVRKEGEGA
jgi:hypothetical protein